MTHDQAQLPQVNGLLAECGTCEEDHLLFPSAPSACSSFLAAGSSDSSVSSTSVNNMLGGAITPRWSQAQSSASVLEHIKAAFPITVACRSSPDGSGASGPTDDGMPQTCGSAPDASLMHIPSFTSANIEDLGNRTWMGASKSSKFDCFMAFDEQVRRTMSENAKTASSILCSPSINAAVAHIVDSKVTGEKGGAEEADVHAVGGEGAKEGTYSIQNSSMLQLQQIVPSTPIALAGYHGLLHTLRASNPVSVDGPSLPGDLHQFMKGVVEAASASQSTLPQPGESVLVRMEGEPVPHALAFVISKASPALLSLGESKRALLTCSQHVAVSWCSNAGDAPESLRYHHSAAVIAALGKLGDLSAAGSDLVEAAPNSSATRDLCVSRSAGQLYNVNPPDITPSKTSQPTVLEEVKAVKIRLSPSKATLRHAFAGKNLDVIHIHNIVKCGQVAITDSKAALKTKAAIFKHVSDVVQTPAQITGRPCVPFVQDSRDDLVVHGGTSDHHFASSTELDPPPKSRDDHISLSCGSSNLPLDFGVPRPGVCPEPANPPGSQAFHNSEHLGPMWTPTYSGALSFQDAAWFQSDLSMAADNFTVLGKAPGSTSSFSTTGIGHAEPSPITFEQMTSQLERNLLNCTNTTLSDDPIDVEVVRTRYHVGSLRGADQFRRPYSEVRVVPPTGLCRHATTNELPCVWQRLTARKRNSVITATMGIIDIRLTRYKCNTHKGCFEVGTRESFDNFRQYYPDVDQSAFDAVSLSVPFIPLTAKLRLDEAAATSLWQLYCEHYRGGVAAIARSWQKIILNGAQGSLTSVHALGLVRQFCGEGCTAGFSAAECQQMVAIASARASHACLQRVTKAITNQLVDSAITQLHHAIISMRMPQYWRAMARLSGTMGIDFTFRAAQRFSVSEVVDGKRTVYKVHANLSTVVGQFGFLIAGHIGGGNESASRIYTTAVGVLQGRAALSRELGGQQAAAPAAIAIDNPHQYKNTLDLAIKNVWPASIGEFDGTETSAVAHPASALVHTPLASSSSRCDIHMDHFHYVERVRDVVRQHASKVTDSNRFNSLWTDFVNWILAPPLSVQLPDIVEQTLFLNQVSVQARLLFRAYQLLSKALPAVQLTESISNVVELLAKQTCEACMHTEPQEDFLPQFQQSAGELFQRYPSDSVTCIHRQLAADLYGLVGTVPLWLSQAQLSADRAAACIRCFNFMGWALLGPASSHAVAFACLKGSQQTTMIPLKNTAYPKPFVVPYTVLVRIGIAVGVIAAPIKTHSFRARAFQERPVPAESRSRHILRLRVIGPELVADAQKEGVSIATTFANSYRNLSSGSLSSVILAAVTESAIATTVCPPSLDQTSSLALESTLQQTPADKWLPPAPRHSDDAQKAVTDLWYELRGLCVCPGSVMGTPAILHAVLASLKNEDALNGLLAQQHIPIISGGTNHAEAAHSRLSAALGPSSSLSLSKAEQRIELHALDHNRRKAEKIMGRRENRRKQAAFQELQNVAQISISTINGAATSHGHPLSSGAICSAVLACSTFKCKSIEELKKQGLKVEELRKVTMNADLHSSIARILQQSVAERVSGTHKFSLTTLPSRIRTAVDEPGLTNSQIRRVALDCAASRSLLQLDMVQYGESDSDDSDDEMEH